MDKRRSFVFIFSFSLILMGLLLMQQNMKPKIENNQDQEQVSDQDAEQENSDDPNDEKQNDSEDADSPNSGESSEADGKKANETVDEEAEQDKIRAARPEQFLTLGSLDPDSSDRLLVTFTTRNGSIKKIESNFRKKRKKRLAYRDLEYKGGYLGDLQLKRTVVDEDEEGKGRTAFEVRSVGKGTPADLAGMQVGDGIMKLDDAPVLSIEDFEYQLSRLKPKDVVSISVFRNGETNKLDVTLSEKPIEIIRPEPDSFDTGQRSPESFLLTLRKIGVVGSNWPELDSELLNNQWDFQQTTVDGRPAIEFSYVISKKKLEALELDGPIRIVRTYWLPEVPEEERYDISSRTFHINTRLRIENESANAQKFAYQLNGPTGTPTEGWWYINKIHGRSWAIGYTAGTRDIAGINNKPRYIFFGGPEIAKNVKSSSPILQYVFDAGDEVDQQMRAIGVDTQYFNVSLLPTESKTNTESPYLCDSAIAALSGSQVPDKNQKLARLADCTFLLFDRIEVGAGDAYTQDFEIFAGPKEPKLLASYGLESNRTFGWFAMFSKPLCWLLKFFYNITGQFSYGLAIIMLTVLVRSLMIPISRKAALNAQMMQALQPKMKEIADKYKDEMEKRAHAQRELFRKHNYNPFGGCLLMFFQLPIFIGLYRGLSVDIALRDQPLIPGMSWCSNLAAPDQLFYWKDYLWPMLGGETGFLGPYFNLLPMFTIVLFLIQQKMFTPPATDDNQKMMQKMMTFMMFFMGILFFKVPAALCLYFITSSLWGIIERKMLPKPKLSEDKLSELGASDFDDGGETETETRSDKEKRPGLLDRLKDAVEQNATGKSRPVSHTAEEKKQIDRDRKKRLKKRGL